MAKPTEDFDVQCRRALEDRDGFWTEAAERLVWTKKWTQLYDGSNAPLDRWYVGGELNLCYNCLDRHVEEGFGDRTAFVFHSPVTNTEQDYTFSHILYQVSRLAGVLRGLGVQKGEVVMVYMPMIPEGVFSMLACARIGALHVCVPSGLPSKDLSKRIDHCKPKVVLTASHGFHSGGWLDYKLQLDSACHTSQAAPTNIIVFQRKNMDAVSMTIGRDLDWTEEINSATGVPCVPVEANEPAFMIYTSGSTAEPKGVVHGLGRYIVRLKVDIPLMLGHWDDTKEEVIFMASNFGWIAGHSIVVYGPLMEKLKTIVFEGDPLLTEDVHTLYRLLDRARVTKAIIRPGILKVLKLKDEDRHVAFQYNFQKLKLVLIGGERIDQATLDWSVETFQTSVINGYGQTELSAIMASMPETIYKETEKRVVNFVKPFPGWEVAVVKPDNTPVGAHEPGRLLIRLPLPPGTLLTLFGNQELFLKNYYKEYPGYFDTKDEVILDETGGIKCHCRSDDIMKVGLIYLAAQELEEIAAAHPAILQCIVVSFPDLIWKELPVVLYTKKEGCQKTSEEVAQELEQMVTKSLGSVVKLGGAVAVPELPLTRTGKIHRSSCNSIIKGHPIASTGAVENPEVLVALLAVVKAAGFGRDVLLE